MTGTGEAREQIRQLKARYFRLMDEKRWDEWQKVFTDDVVIETPDDGVPEPIHGNQVFAELLRELLEGVRTVHHGHMPEIDVTGEETATGVWAMEDQLFWPAEKGGMRMWGTGWYEEEYRREPDGQWRISRMRLRRNRVEVDGQQTFPSA